MGALLMDVLSLISELGPMDKHAVSCARYAAGIVQCVQILGNINCPIWSNIP